MKKDINWKSITTKPQSTVLQPDCHFSLLGHVTLYSIYNVVSTTFKLQSCIFLKPKKPTASVTQVSDALSNLWSPGKKRMCIH